jgi:cobalt-zinc-cadmium efflux system protein
MSEKQSTDGPAAKHPKGCQHIHKAAPEGHSQHGHHHHGHHHGHSSIENIRFAFFLNFTFSIIELVGGFYVGSMAIVADAIHDFGDSISLGAAWFLERYSTRARDSRFNFGYRRFSLLAALISGLVITAGAAVIVFESVRRLGEPVTPATGPMIALAVVGFVVNGIAALRLSRGESQNEKVLTWHLIEDVMGWATILVGALVIRWTGAAWIDPLMAIGVSVFVSFNVFRYLKNTLYLFLQGRPDSFLEEEFTSEVLEILGVERVDHLAVWSLDGERSILSARIHLHSVREPIEIENIKSQVRVIAARHGVVQATLETCLSNDVMHVDDENPN